MRAAGALGKSLRFSDRGGTGAVASPATGSTCAVPRLHLAEPAAVTEPLRETPLAALHRAAGARMVPFAGYAMPVQYPTGILAEHAWTRGHAGLFDVSHMGPAFLTLTRARGEGEADHAALVAIVETLTSGDLRSLRPGQMRYTLMLNE